MARPVQSVPTKTTSVLYSTANDPQPQMIPRPQMIPKMDRKWSSTASDPQSWPQMIPWKLEEWNGFYGTNYKKGLIIKKGTFFSRLLKKKGRRALNLRSIYTRPKKVKLIWKGYGINRILLHLSIASIFFKELFRRWKFKTGRTLRRKKLYYFNAQAQLVYWGIQSQAPST